MKKLITVILILAAGQAFAQKTVNDTLIIQYSPKIKFIKFGERIYEVVQPLLKEVVPETTPYWQRGVDSSFLFAPRSIYPLGNLKLEY
jgi:hypothetical protein